MKKNQDNANPVHHVETPPPPQVMDPSKPPKKQGINPDNKSRDPKKEQTDKAKPQPLAPREEL